jgi:hypothetical protein
MTARTARTSKKAAAVQAAYAKRTGMDSRSAIILAAAHTTKPETFVDEDGNTVRIWDNSETYTHADIASCLANRVAVEENEMLGTIPPRAIKYATTKGWLVPNASRTLFSVTLKGAIDLNLPLYFRGKFNGRKIRFAAAPAK